MLCFCPHTLFKHLCCYSLGMDCKRKKRFQYLKVSEKIIAVCRPNEFRGTLDLGKSSLTAVYPFCTKPIKFAHLHTCIGKHLNSSSQIYVHTFCIGKKQIVIVRHNKKNCCFVSFTVTGLTQRLGRNITKS